MGLSIFFSSPEDFIMSSYGSPVNVSNSAVYYIGNVLFQRRGTPPFPLHIRKIWCLCTACADFKHKDLSEKFVFSCLYSFDNSSINAGRRGVRDFCSIIILSASSLPPYLIKFRKRPTPSRYEFRSDACWKNFLTEVE